MALLMCYPKSVRFIAFHMDFGTYDDIIDTIWIIDKKLLHFKLTKLGQILRVDKTGFPRPGHICIIHNYKIVQWRIFLHLIKST